MHALNLVFLLLPQLWVTIAQPSFLNVTAIAGVGGRSVFQCWRLETPFTSVPDLSINGIKRAELGQLSNMYFLVLPAHSESPPHNAPANQWVAQLSGLTHYSLPDDPAASFTVVGGEFGLIFAADTLNVSRRGHVARFTGNVETVTLQIPARDGKVPAHEVLHESACVASEVLGIRAFATPGVAQKHVL